MAALASQKRHMALYMMGTYGADDAWFRERWQATGDLIAVHQRARQIRNPERAEGV